MGYNTHHWDREAHYKAKTTKQLQEELEKFRQGLESLRSDPRMINTTAFPFYENHIEYLRMKIAERIGK